VISNAILTTLSERIGILKAGKPEPAIKSGLSNGEWENENHRDKKDIHENRERKKLENEAGRS